MAKTKKKSPSRVRYDQGHPTVSCRIPKELYERLKAVKVAEGRSFTDILKVGLGILEVSVVDKGKVRKQGYDEGCRKGWAEAESRYKVSYPCKLCGQIIHVASSEEKEAIKRYMKEHGWGHGACHEKTV